MRSACARTLALPIILAPTAALAHAGAGDAHGFTDGFLHPLNGLDHVLAMVAAGMLAWQLGGRAVWLVPSAFVSLMAVGAALGMTHEPVAWVEIAIAASVAVLGAVVALRANLPVAAAMGIAGGFAIFHGYAHGTAIPTDASGIAYAAGFTLATALLHVAGIGIGLLIGRASEPYGKAAWQLGGGAVAAAGLAILAQAVM